MKTPMVIHLPTPQLRPELVARVPSRTGFIGVVENNHGSYSARLANQHLGTFQTGEQAARVRDAAAIEKYGPYAYVNFPAGVEQIAVAA